MKALHFVLTNILKDIKKHFIQDVPDDLYGCLSCKKAHCSKITWEFCEDRIRHITNTSVAQANDKYTLEAETTYHYFEESKKNI